MQDNRERVKSLYAAFARRDVATVVSLVSPEIQITQSAALPWGGRFSGYGGLQKFFDTLLSHIDSKVEIENVLDAGDSLVVLGRTRGTVRANGRTFDIPIAHVWEVQNGQFVSFRPHIENAIMLEALKG